MSAKKFDLRVLAPIAFALGGCSDRIYTTGLEEPLSVHDAQFVEGELPGTAPPKPGQDVKKPDATAPTADTLYLRPGLANVRFAGLVSDRALSVAVALKGQGTGYWLFPAGAPDPSQTGYLDYDFVADFHESLPAGRHEFLVAAIDADGNSGSQASTSLCINSLVPDYGNACDPTIQPPDLVVSLRWDTPADLDLVVVTPSGKVVSPQNPTTAEPDASGHLEPNAPGVGNLDLDSNRDCKVDARQLENLVFHTVPKRATYHVYANLNRACDQASVTYELSYHLRVPGKEAGTFAVQSSVKAAGTLVADQANAGTAVGTFVTDLVIGK